MIAAEGLAAVGRMIAAYHGSDGAATDFKIAWVTVTLRDLEGHQRCLCPDGSRASAVVDRCGWQCGPAGAARVSADARVPARLAAWQSGNGAVQGRPTRLRPVARVQRTSVDVRNITMQKHSHRMRRLTAAGLLPERAGQPVKVWAHISLADLLRLDGSSALQEEWTAHVRARWAASRAAASETGSDGGPGWTGTPPRPSRATRRWPPS